MKRRNTISFVLVLLAALLMTFAGNGQALAAGKGEGSTQPAINAAYPSKDVYTAKVTAPGGLKIKKSMNTRDDLGVTVPNGKIVSIIKRESNNWYEIRYQDDTGYVKGIMLVDNKDVMYTTAKLNLRTDIGKSVILTMPKGEAVEVIDRENKEWLLVNYKGKIGYASAEYLSKEKPKEEKKEDTKKDSKKTDTKNTTKKQTTKKEEPAKTIDLKNVKFTDIHTYYNGRYHSLPRVKGLPKDVKVTYSTTKRHKNVGEYSVTAEFKAARKQDKLRNAQKKTAKLVITIKKGSVFTKKNYKVKVTDPKLNGKGTLRVIKPVSKKIKELKVPKKVKIGGIWFNITAVGREAFAGCKKLKKVTLSDNMKTIGYGAFSDCKKLEKVKIGKGLKTLKTNAFRGDKKLKSITFKSKKITKVGKNVFKGINKKAVIKVPKKKLKKYTKLFAKKGQGKNVVIK